MDVGPEQLEVSTAGGQSGHGRDRLPDRSCGVGRHGLGPDESPAVTTPRTLIIFSLAHS